MYPARVKRLWSATASRTRRLTVILDGVHDPHNFSAVARSVEGFGLLDLHVIETHAPLRLSSKVTQGAEKWIDFHRYSEPGKCLEALEKSEFELWFADPGTQGRQVKNLPWEKKLALVFGNEHEGPSSAIRRGAAGSFRIPMHGFSQSLNISVATGITLAIAAAEREKKLGSHGDLSESECTELAAEWQRRSVRCADKIMERLRDDIFREDENIEGTI